MVLLFQLSSEGRSEIHIPYEACWISVIAYYLDILSAYI